MIAVYVSMAATLSGGRDTFGAMTAASPAAPMSVTDSDVAVERIVGALRIDASFPGVLRAYAVPSGADHRRQILLLIEPPAPSSVPGGASASSAGAEDTAGDGPQLRDGGKKSGSGGDTTRSASDGSKTRGRKVSIRVHTSANGARSEDSDASTHDGPQSEGPPLWLLAIEPGDPPHARIVRKDVPPDVRALDAADTDGDGIDDLLLWRPRGLDVIHRDRGGSYGSIERLVDDPEIQPRGSDARAVCDLDCGDDRIVWSSILGALRGYGTLPSGATTTSAHNSGHELLEAAPQEQPSPAANPMGTSAPRDNDTTNRDGTSGSKSTPVDPHAPVAVPGRSRWGIVAEMSLPVSTTRSAGALNLSSPVVRPVPPPLPFAGSDSNPQGSTGSQSASASPSSRLIALGPEPFGEDRLHTLLLDPAHPHDEAVESWSLLPGPEKLIESTLLRIDGRPALAVTTRSAEKLSLFKEKWLRVFFLEADRTKRGHVPVLAVETRINLWQPTEPVAIDVDRDGRQDLVLPYWKGLKNSHLVLDTYLRKEDGSFERSPRSTSFEVEDANRSFLDFGHDLDGDGIADVVIMTKEALQVYPGWSRSSHGGDLVEHTPRWSLHLRPASILRVNMPNDDGEGGSVRLSTEGDAAPTDPRATNRPRFVDLDADGREEIVLFGPAYTGGGHIIVYRFPPRR